MHNLYANAHDYKQAKKDLAKKEGRLLTDKQKREQRAAEIRREALIGSGVRIEGLEQPASSSSGPVKKVVYGKKKKPVGAKGDQPASPVATSPAPAPPKVLAAPKSIPLAAPVTEVPGKDAWDASSDSEPEPSTPAVDAKDSWDAESSEDEEKSKPAPGNYFPVLHLRCH